MCLGIPGKITSILDEGSITRTGKVSFGGVLKDINLSYVPEANVDDYVIIHAGFAISILDESEAQEVFEYLRAIDEAGRTA